MPEFGCFILDTEPILRSLRPKRFAPRVLAAIATVLAALPVLAQQAQADEPFSIADSLARSRFTLELRPRYNRIDEGDKPERTEGGTMRAVAGIRTAPVDGVRLALEGINASHLGGHFNDNGALFATSPYPLLPDPRYTGVNQAYIDYSGVDSLALRAGRQVVRMDNQRWISDNDFRQIPQVFDGAGATFTGLPGTELYAGYFRQVRSTSGTTQKLRLTLLHAAWNPAPGHSIAAYGFFHDQPQNGSGTRFADSSYKVIGVRAEGTVARGGAIDFPYTAEYAIQRPFANGDSRIHAPYWRLGAGVAYRDNVVRVDYEVKGSNNGVFGAEMPLTDFYGLNGWTLNFFNTPRQGLRDGWITVRHGIHGVITLYAEAHRFRSDYGDLDLGRELDVGATWTWNENLSLRLQHARYDPGSGLVDSTIRKTWLTLTYTF